MPRVSSQHTLCCHAKRYCLGTDADVMWGPHQCVQVLVGGSMVRPPGGEEGQFFAPTVLVGVTPAMRIWQEEVFGPVLAVVRFTDDDDAVRLANDCAFGLGSAVFSRSQRRANAIARQLQA